MTLSEWLKLFVNARPSDLGSPPLVFMRDALDLPSRRYVESAAYGNAPYVLYEINGGPVSTPLYGDTAEYAVRLDLYVMQSATDEKASDRTDIDLLFGTLAHAPQFVDADEDGRPMSVGSFQLVAQIPPRLLEQTGQALIGTLRFAYGVRI